MGHVGLALSAARDDDVVAGIDQPRDEERADVTGPADDYDSNGRLGWSLRLGCSEGI
jgi:hypothetical protein